MDVFSQIPDGVAIITNGGVYRQADLYERGGRVFAKHGGGFVRMLCHAKTSHPKVRWVEYDTPGVTTIEAPEGVLIVKGE